MEFLKTLAREADLMSSPSSRACVNTPLIELHDMSSPMAALHAAVVMELMVDELEILSATVNAGKPDLRSTSSKTLDQYHRPKVTPLPPRNSTLSSVEEERKWIKNIRASLEQNYTSVIPRRMEQGLGDISLWPRDAAKSMMAKSKVKTDTQAGKHQLSLTFLQMIADNLLRELLQNSSFGSLASSVQSEQTALKRIWVTCKQLTKDQVTMSSLKNEMKAVEKEKTDTCRELDAEIFILNDKCIEVNKRCACESRLTDKQVKMLIRRFRRKHRHMLKNFHSSIHEMKKRHFLEQSVHDNIKLYLDRSIESRENQFTYWVEKYETDYNQLGVALDELINARNIDLKRIAWLKMMILRREPIVMDDRRIKMLSEKLRLIELRRIWAAIKIQSWWRGTMVRNLLGPYRPVIEHGKKGPKTDKDAKKKK